MRVAIFVIAVLCLIQYGYTYSCYRTQTTSCSVAETPCMSSCPMYNSCNSYSNGGCNGCCNSCSSGCCNSYSNGCCNSCSSGCCNSCPNMCGCSAPCGCYREACNVCCECNPTPSPVCSCMKECDCKSMIYFPEVQYPVTIMEVTPNYYGTCWSY